MEVLNAAGKPLRGDLIKRVVLRTDLTPIPSTVEISAIANKEALEAFQDGALIYVGAEKLEFRVVKPRLDTQPEVLSNGREVATISATGILNSCYALATPLQRSIVRESATMTEIYRSIGAQVQVANDFAVPRFSAFIGMHPTKSIAQVLQEEGGIVFLADGKLHFRRVYELMAEKASISWDADRTEFVESGLMERHAFPSAMSTAPNGSVLISGREAGRSVVYLPRSDSRVLSNMATGLVQRRKAREGLSPMLNAGARIDVASKPHIVITAAHVFTQRGEQGGGGEYTQLWLGEAVK